MSKRSRMTQNDRDKLHLITMKFALRGPTPCDRCEHLRLCASAKWACINFRRYTRGRWHAKRHGHGGVPSRALYLEIHRFDRDEALWIFDQLRGRGGSGKTPSKEQLEAVTA